MEARVNAHDPTLEEMVADAIGLFEVGRVADAQRRLDRILEQDGQLPTAWYYRGRCLQQVGDIVGALPCFQTAAQLKPDYAAAHCEIGFCLNTMGRYAEALPHFTDALQRDPTMHAARINSGFALERLARFEEAVECYQKLLSRDPLNANCLQNVGSCLLQLGRPQEALECFQDAYDLGDDQVKEMATVGLDLCRAVLGH
jgi:tetratricopeptide (TPR) repeat protein